MKSGRVTGYWTKVFVMLGCGSVAGCNIIGDTPRNSRSFTLQASDAIAATDDVNWIVVTILEAEQFHCDPNPQVVMFDTHLCANTIKEMTVEYRIEGRLVEVTLHGQGTAASRRDRSILMQHAETVLESFAAAGFRLVDTI